MQKTSKYVKYILFCAISTFLSAVALGVVFTYIQAFLFGVLLLTFWFNPLVIIAQYFFVKKHIDNYCKREISGMEWVLVRLNIILAQLAGVTMAYPLVLYIYKFFPGTWTGIFAIYSVRIGMGVPLVIMFLGVGIKELYPEIRTLLKNKREMAGGIEDNKVNKKLLILIMLMLVLIVAGFGLGKKLEWYPSVWKLFQSMF